MCADPGGRGYLLLYRGEDGAVCGVYLRACAEEADKVGLPILELPEALPYIDIIVNVMNLIFEEEGNSAILEKYVKDILYENYSDRVLMAERGRLFGMDVEHDWFAAVVINFRKMVVPDEQDWKGIRFLARAVLGLFRERTEITECIRIPLKKGYLLLAEGETEDKVRTVLADLFTEEKIRELWDAGADRIVCAAGSVRRGLTGIRDTYSDAFQAIRVQRKLWPETSVCQYEKVRAFCALQEFFESGRGKTFEEILKPVESQEFLDTLATYFSCSGNLDQAAELLHAHKNTVKYRLGRIQTLTGLDLKKPEDNFMIYMAVLAWKLGAGV